MSDQPTELDPTTPPVDYANVVDPKDPAVTVAPDQTPTYVGEDA